MECYAIWVDAMHECMKRDLLAGEHRGNPRLHDPEGIHNLLGDWGEHC